MTVRDRLAELGLQLPAPVTAPPGVRLPFGMPVEVEAVVAITSIDLTH